MRVAQEAREREAEQQRLDEYASRRRAFERKKREIDPTMTLLREVLMQEPASVEERHAQERMREMHDLFELLTGWYADVQRLDTERLVQLLTLGSKVQKILEMKDRLFVVPGSKKSRREDAKDK